MNNPLTGRPYLKDYFDAERVEALLLCVGVDANQLDVMRDWNPDQLAAAGDWALRSHLRASDNNTVRVPPQPSHVPDIRPLNEGARTVMDL